MENQSKGGYNFYNNKDKNQANNGQFNYNTEMYSVTRDTNCTLFLAIENSRK